jgi:glycosyltransferase involved in cell wall biosynthesis
VIAVTFHDLAEPYVFPLAGPLRRWSVDLLRECADVCIYVDGHDYTQMGAGNPSHWRSSQVIPAGPTIEPPHNLVTRDEIRAQLGLPTCAFLVGFFGFRQSGKGLESLANAMRTPELSAAGVHLVLVGSSLPRMRGHRSAGEVAPATFEGLDVIDPGLLSAENVSRWLRACDVAALPYEEGLSTRRGTFMVAVAHGLPVVTTFPVRPDLVGICEGDVAFTPTNDSDALARALIRVRDDPAHRAKLTSGSRAVSRRYSWPCIARQTLDAYGG